MDEGYVNTIETFGTLDGPGIRYVLFLQGCPLRCKFCHNRDTWDRSSGKKTSVEEVVADAEQYLPFYQNSGGGLTISGGEPMLQIDFACKLFQAVKDRLHLHTALDTCGLMEPEKAEALIRWTDLVLMDIKAVDPDEHKALTGVSNEKILVFANWLQKIGKPVWIRHVLIPGVNDDKEHLTALAELIRDKNHVERVEILGYHKLGIHKWEEFDQEDPLAHVPTAKAEDVERAREFLRAQGLAVVS
jgi:pyruvate formate lyase activating enzyme